MKAAILILATLLPATAAAQNPDVSFPASTQVPSASAQRPAPAARPLDRRRRGSMVGYVADAAIESQIRVRFDAGYHNERPDRAEFFYAKCGCYTQLLGNAAYDPVSPGPGPGIVSDLNFQQLYFQAQVAMMNDRVALFGEVPLRWIQPQTFLAGGPPGSFGSQSGLGDLRAGLKLALASTDTVTATAQVQGYFPTGKANKGLGTDHVSVEPALLVYGRLGDRASLESQIGLWHPFGGSDGVPITSSDKFAGDVLFYGIGPSFELVSTDRVRFGPVVELVGWRVLKGMQTGDGDPHANIVNLKLGARAIVDGQSSFYVGYGRALTSKAGWYDDILRLEFRYSF